MVKARPTIDERTYIPPKQPWSARSQSRSCCTLRLSSFPLSVLLSSPLLVATKCAPSIEPTLLKAQQDPQAPWFFTEVTPPFSTQSIDAGRSRFLSSCNSRRSIAMTSDLSRRWKSVILPKPPLPVPLVPSSERWRLMIPGEDSPKKLTRWYSSTVRSEKWLWPRM